MSHILTILFAFALLSPPGNGYSQNLKLTILNATPYDLSNLKIGGEEIKLLRSGDRKTVTIKETIHWQDGAPFGDVNATAVGHPGKYFRGLYCGTAVFEQSSGKFNISIIIEETNGGYFLKWKAVKKGNSGS